MLEETNWAYEGSIKELVHHVRGGTTPTTAALVLFIGKYDLPLH